MSDELPTTPPVSAGSAGLVDRAKGILMTPKEEWAKVAAEAKAPTEVLLQYALPLMAIGPICSVLGGLLAPYSLGLTYYVSSARAGASPATSPITPISQVGVQA